MRWMNLATRRTDDEYGRMTPQDRVVLSSYYDNQVEKSGLKGKIALLISFAFLTALLLTATIASTGTDILWSSTIMRVCLTLQIGTVLLLVVYLFEQGSYVSAKRELIFYELKKIKNDYKRGKQ